MSGIGFGTILSETNKYAAYGRPGNLAGHKHREGWTSMITLLCLSLLWVLCGLCALRVKSLSFASQAAAVSLFALLVASSASTPQEAPSRSYLGFDRNDYPGDDALPILRKTFAFSSYWLSPPPGEKTNTWSGKRELLRALGFGFAVLYRGPDSNELKTEVAAKARGTREGEEAAASAKAEGFPAGTIIFLDIEEGGRLSPDYHAYIQGWLWALTQLGYQGGFYCSGIPVKEDARSTITTADDIIKFLSQKSRAFKIWAYNDACPPSPGCTFPHEPPPPAKSGIAYAAIWQFAQSPRRKEFTRRCPAKYAADGNCYARGDTGHAWFLDVNIATSPNPSGGAR